MAEICSSRASFAQLTRIIEKDSVLTAAVLRRANSALYQRGCEIRSLTQALTFLGLEDLRRFILAVSSNRSWGRIQFAPNFSRSRYSRHVLATAVMADLLDRELGGANGGHAQVAALLHDVGRLVAAAGLKREFALITETGEWNEAREAEIFGMQHGELSAIVLRAWGMAAEVCEAVEMHHCEPAAASRPRLAAVIHAADEFAAAFVAAEESQSGAFDESPLYGLGIDNAIPAIVAEFHRQTAAAENGEKGCKA